MPTIELLASQADELTIPLSQMALLLVDWTDPSKAVWVMIVFDGEKLQADLKESTFISEREGATSDEKIHFYLAQDLLQLVAQRGNRKLTIDVSRTIRHVYWPQLQNLGELRKTVVALLSKLYLPDQLDELQVKGMVLLIRNIVEVRMAPFARKDDVA
jgi:hypothetical protein